MYVINLVLNKRMGIIMENVRKFWLDAMLKISTPVLDNLSKRQLKQQIPLSFHEDRSGFAPLEAFGRCACGMAPWLELEGLEGEEKVLQEKYRKMFLECLDAATDPDSPDYMDFTGKYGGQPLVDAAFLAHALLRAPEQTIGKLDNRVKHNLIQAFRLTKTIINMECNWIFFTAMVECGLYLLGDEEYDTARMEIAIKLYENWYKGDGTYGDGMMFHWDYYNSFVIQPMYIDVLHTLVQIKESLKGKYELVLKRASRYAEILERMISPEGTYPIIGRSVCYRFGAFQLLSQAALQNFLPEHETPSQVRCGLTAVIQRVMADETMFDANGWLQPGVIGLQPELAEQYINIGSLYLCMAVFLPLGIAPTKSFWAAEDEDWTEKKIWGGKKARIDHALD